MTANPVLEEVWQIKDQLAAESGNDIDRFFEQLQAWSDAHSDRVVRKTGERPSATPNTRDHTVEKSSSKS